MKYYYLAYGSNLNLSQMYHRCKTAEPIGTVKLKGFRLAFKGVADGFAHLTIEEHENSTVPMGLFEVLSIDVKRLDIYEGYPRYYHKEQISVKIGAEKVNAFVYIMNKGFDYHLPSKSYFKTCYDGYSDFQFNKGYLIKAYAEAYLNAKKEITPPKM